MYPKFAQKFPKFAHFGIFAYNFMKFAHNFTKFYGSVASNSVTLYLCVYVWLRGRGEELINAPRTVINYLTNK